LLNEFDNTDSFFDDPILNSFRDQYYAEFEILEEDADIKPLNTNQILFLDSHLEDIEKKLDKYKSDKNSDDIEEIKGDIKILRENLTTKSKKWVIENLSKVWAKITKQGTTLLKEFLSESKREMIKQGVKGVIEAIKENGLDLLT